jgi:hypothetical protein
LSEKIKEINSKIPNYFLPKEDLEKTMRKLHYNYTEVNIIYIIRFFYKIIKFKIILDIQKRETAI